jgi:tetratricopeptide (TPR) repeat protein
VQKHHRFRKRWPLATLLIAIALPLVAQPTVDWPGEIRILVSAHQIDRAMKTTEEWINKYPDDLDARAWHARILGWQGHSDESEREYRALLDKTPDDPDLLLELSRLLNSGRQNLKALELLERATLKAPERVDCLLEKARTLAAVGRRNEARAIYLKLAAIDSSSEQSKTALRDLREEGRQRLVVGANADLLSYTANGSALSAELHSRWTGRWSTIAGVTRYGRFGKSASGIAASTTFRLSPSDAITVGGATAGNAGIAPHAQLQLGYDRGLRLHLGAVRGLELTYEQKWVWYKGVRTVNFAPSALLQFSRNWSWLLGVSTARIVLEAGKPSWSPAAQTRLTFPLYRRCTGQAIFASGAENFGTLDQVLFRASRAAAGGLRFHIAPGQEISTLIGYQQISGGRSQISTGLTYAVRF